ncbi:hypothetical protein FQA39_LY07059 [Lamprigera yunnana]|nr:hypothetical protein FQA39_LY07059 [Lamprigera yunnana]
MSVCGNRRNFNRKQGNKFQKPQGNRTWNRSSNMPFFSQQSFTEKEVGITEYLSAVEGFSGVIKARFSDFHVNEINNYGEIAKLTDLSPPADFISKPSDEKGIEDTSLLSTEIWRKIRDLSSNSDAEPFEIDADNFDKEHRMKIYECVRKLHGKKIIINTAVKQEKRLMYFKKYTKDVPVDTRFQWPKDKGEYVYFLVYKESVDTVEASFKISYCVRMKSSLFTYAGVKDKRAKTTQWFCIKKVDPVKLLYRTRHLRNIHLGNISFHDKPLKLGQLKGNRFQIALRNVTATEATINRALESLKTNGFINYYGLQRFGSDKDVPTFKIGVALLRGNWKEACDLILDPKKSEDPNSEISHAKRVFKETSNSEMANNQFYRWQNKCVESKLLLGFTKNHANDYVNALENIPRNMRLLYIHSFQSLIWNIVVSRRLKVFGLQPILGDLVLISDGTEPSNENVEDIGEESTSNEEITGDQEIVEKEEDENINKKDTINHQEVKVLTQDDLSTYTIYDIVLPLPGYDMKYPENEVKNWFKELLQEYGLSLELPKQKVKTYNLSGTYRKILSRAKDLSWKTIRYNHPNDTLIRSDYEELIGQEEPMGNPEGQYKGLVLDFCLDSSCYATMVLRELLKLDTSISEQLKLNDYHNSKEKNECLSEVNSLLSDSTKYEKFKLQIYNTASENLKHKAEDDGDFASKKLKTSEENDGVGSSSEKSKISDKDTRIKIKPSLV